MTTDRSAIGCAGAGAGAPIMDLGSGGMRAPRMRRDPADHPGEAGRRASPPRGPAAGGRLPPVRDPLPPPSGPALLALLAGTALLARSQLTHGLLAAVVDGFDLVVHEAGHPVLGLLGSRLLMFLGGTILQLALPAAAALAFAARRQPASLAAALVWLGINLVNVGRYAADAEARALPLLAADADAHDWWNVLGALGLRSQAPIIGGAIAAAGWALQAAAPGWVLVRWLSARLDAAGPR